MTNQKARLELHAALQQAAAQRARTTHIENIVGNVLMSILAACVGTVVVLWLIK
jgi:hypothetical protein